MRSRTQTIYRWTRLPAAGKGIPLKIKVDGKVFEGDKFGDGRGIFTSEGKEQYLGEFSEERETAHGYGVVIGSRGQAGEADQFWGQFAEGKWHEYRVHYHFLEKRPSENSTNLKRDLNFHLFDEGNVVHSAVEYEHGSCMFDDKPCSATDERFADLKRHALEAEARHRPAALTQPRTHTGSVFARGRLRRSESSNISWGQRWESTSAQRARASASGRTAVLTSSLTTTAIAPRRLASPSPTPAGWSAMPRRTKSR